MKTVIGAYGWLDELFDEIERRGSEGAPDFITLDGADGSTGATSIPLTGKLERHGLRKRARVVASGKLVTPADVPRALCMGADYVCSARGFMFAQGYIHALQCYKNISPTGMITHDPKLRHARELRRHHARVVRREGMTRSLDMWIPPVQIPWN